MDTRYNIKITDISVRDRLKLYQIEHDLPSQEKAIEHALDIAENQPL